MAVIFVLYIIFLILSELNTDKCTLVKPDSESKKETFHMWCNHFIAYLLLSLPVKEIKECYSLCQYLVKYGQMYVVCYCCFLAHGL